MAGRSFRRTLLDLLCRAPCKTKRGPRGGRPQQWAGTTSRRTQIELTVVGNGDYDVTTRVLSSANSHNKIHTKLQVAE